MALIAAKTSSYQECGHGWPLSRAGIAHKQRARSRAKAPNSFLARTGGAALSSRGLRIKLSRGLRAMLDGLNR